MVRELSRLASIKLRRTLVEDFIDANEQEIQKLRVSAASENAALWVLADRRLRYLQARNQELRTEHAGIAAEMEKQKLQAAVAVGKHDAFSRSRVTGPSRYQF